MDKRCVISSFIHYIILSNLYGTMFNHYCATRLNRYDIRVNCYASRFDLHVTRLGYYVPRLNHYFRGLIITLNGKKIAF